MNWRRTADELPTTAAPVLGHWRSGQQAIDGPARFWDDFEVVVFDGRRWHRDRPHVRFHEHDPIMGDPHHWAPIEPPGPLEGT